ncbi:fungal-specific transcription factor domain-containing protein [Ilyonectria robusta]|uniref:fungal-specific transcription factor domain-containing protein n=1 Tax=Ilyonectria robusta TaxID=1079257 RepID=UPI001E8E2B68|nr:fungal-specific transcription factor domain-containing protein [Ilyonectria robusta]KAH8729870.1 fungal-specific transcription factor domain-containing protein [Ilyonectria robusta]
MSPHSRPSYQPRKHSKTFTGCWTCRGRKVKCDEERPGCRQCRQKNLQCQGYGVRLHWMQPEMGPVGSNADPLPQLPRAKSQRSQISIEPMKSILQCSEIDEILTSIDSLDAHQGGSSSLNVGCFGVFGAASSPPVFTPQIAVSDDRPMSIGSSDSENYFDQPDISDPFNVSDVLPVAVFLDAFSPSEFMGPDSLPIFDFSTPSLTTEDFTTSLYDSTDLVQHKPKDSPRLEVLSPRFSNDAWHTFSQPIPRCPTESPLTKQEQFLMSHYVNRVVRLFCVIDNAKSPWKTIHLPRALQSVGELSIVGSTSRIQGALRNALLSISAFYLSNDNKSRARSDDALKWANEATWFRGKAIKLLKDAVENDFYSVPKPKYKEFLATMLSMISINVMSGDLDTCGVHLDGAWRLMTHARNWKSKYSTKARALHRIYFYLRTIYESTALGGDQAERPCLENSSPESPPAQIATKDTVALPPADDGCPTIHAIIPDSMARMATYESIYGVPQKLLVLLTRAVHLIGQVNEARNRDRTTLIPDHLSSQCDELEICIMDRQIEDELERWLPDGQSVNSDIIRHQTQAFHNAVIIYFAQHIRLLGHRYLQPYIKTVLDNIEAIERIKTETQTLAAPLYWPAFIAASEAFDLELQDRFKRWYEQVEFYGFEAVRTGIRVLTDVWKEGPGSANRRTSLWRIVAMRSGQSLMLT